MLLRTAPPARSRPRSPTKSSSFCSRPRPTLGSSGSPSSPARGAVVRGLVVGACVLAVSLWFVPLPIRAPLWVLAFALLGAALLGTLGLIAAVVSEKIDQVAAFQNFVVVPLTFLSGVFYSIHSLPPFWLRLSHANPFFYMVVGFRYGFFGASDFPLAAI